MATFPTTVSRQLTRGAFAALLALGYSAAHAQVAPKPAPAVGPISPDILYYVDGKQVDKATAESVDPATMVAFVNVLKPAQQQQIFGTATASPAAIITTKANANAPAVLAFNKRISNVVPMVPPTPAQREAITAASSYVTQHYPAARLEIVGVVPHAADRYRATFTDNGKRLYLLFDGQGNPVEN